jgi:hypothetical protein
MKAISDKKNEHWNLFRARRSSKLWFELLMSEACLDLRMEYTYVPDQVPYSKIIMYHFCVHLTFQREATFKRINGIIF